MFAVVQHRISRVIIYTAKPSCRMPRLILLRAVSSKNRSVKATVINSKLHLLHRNIFTQHSRGEGDTSTVTQSATRAFPLRHPKVHEYTTELSSDALPATTRALIYPSKSIHVTSRRPSRSAGQVKLARWWNG
ncbi:hypothetical protein BDP81DRAFT_75328 [Colletotrichum phormii]|uniref:Uncharacterized protein n=1 Tax=Colletotrichum phormii TaxID=359342 RepID=A0AAI9ZL98_9PEZI|nr:uncharacterized protein BDP81DRAFT_75328 [Colletotrichum phormii]KAK1625645.1 hypothetical protein BDP81DRAFT_75328 [Colletotrichum phormii]